MNLPVIKPPDSTQAELKAFDTTCERLAGFDEEITFESIDGFLTALAAGPSLPVVEEWLPALCGDAFERAFADPEALLERTEELRVLPLWMEITDAERQRFVDAGEMPAEEEREVPRRKAHLGRVKCSLGFVVRKRQERSRPLIHPDPGLARATGLGGERGVKMQSLLDGLVYVAGRAGEPGGKRERVGFSRNDRLIELVLERDEMDGGRPVPVPLLRLLRV